MKTWFISGLLALGMTASGFAQLSVSRPDTTSIPASLQPYARAVGSRIRTQGKERVVLDGTFSDPTGTRAARVTVDLSGQVRLDGMRADGASILFDGDTARAGLAAPGDTDQAVLDAFAVDSLAGLLSQLGRGSAFRVLGRGFGPDPSKAEQAGGPVWDIVELTGPRPTRGDHPVETRRYYFDNPTGLLARVRHTDAFRQIETRFSYWGEVDGDMYPGLIEGYADDARVFVFTTQAASAGPAVDTTIFRQP